MEFVENTLIALLSVLGVILTIVAIGLLIRLGPGTTISIPFRFLFRMYLYIFTVLGLLLLTMGLSELMRSGFAEAWGKEFSYRSLRVNLPKEPLHPLEVKQQQDPKAITAPEKAELSRVQEERRKPRQEEARQVGLERALKEGIRNGVAFAIIGIIIWAAHLLARQWLETAEEKSSLINRLYLIMLVVIFGIITIFHLPLSLFETAQFYLPELQPSLDSSYSSVNRPTPGEDLALSVVALVIWIGYLVGANKAARGSD